MHDHMARWWGDHVNLDARSDGAFVERWRDQGRDVVTRGRVILCEPPRRLFLTWADEDWRHETEVAFLLSASDKGCRLALRHTGWDPFPTALRDAHRDGWRHHLANLERYAAGL